MIEQAPHRMGRETPHRRFLRIGIDTLVAALVLLNWVVTQLLAAALIYPPFFMGRIVGRIYQPFAWWWWQYYWPHNSVQIGHSIIPLDRAWRLCDRIVFLSGGCDRDRWRDHQRPAAQVARAGGPSR